VLLNVAPDSKYHVGNNNKTKKLMIGIREIEKTLWALEVSGQAKQP
jgi:hypothetical protein